MIKPLTPEQSAMVEKNMALVTYSIKKYLSNLNLPSSVDYNDIFQEGYIGLCKAVLNFDESRNVAFSTYATKCILGQIHQLYARKLKKDLSQQFISNLVNTDKGDISDIFDKIQAQDNIEETVLFKVSLQEIEHRLNEKQRLALHYMVEGHTQDQIALKVGVSQATISRCFSKIKDAVGF